MKEIILLLQSFSTGLLAPALSLVMLSKGVTLSDLAIVMGVYALSVVILELPTGVFADIAGHKISYIISQIAYIFSFTLFVMGSISLIYIGAIIFGASRALSSGSYDAIYLDEKSKEKGMHKAVSMLNLFSGVGLAVGSIIGGVLISFSDQSFSGTDKYNLLLFVRSFLSVIIITLSIIFIEDTSSEATRSRDTLSHHFHEMISIIKKGSLLQVILFSALPIGVMLFVIETYWQPFFLGLPQARNNVWLLGIISFLFFAGSSIGNIIGTSIISKGLMSEKKLLLTFRLLLSISMLALAFSTSISSYVLAITVCYTCFGISNIPEGILINKNTPSSKRASILSFSSLVIQVGGLGGSLIGKIVVHHFNIPILWLLSSFFMLVMVLILQFSMKKTTT